MLDPSRAPRWGARSPRCIAKCAVAQTDNRLGVFLTVLATPLQGALDSVNFRTYPACYVEWRFGDGAPVLQ